MSLPPLPQSVSNWLFNVIQPSYLYKQLVYAHVYQFLQQHLKKNLNFRIRTQVHTSEETGQSELLINLFGTIVINEHIGVPIEIWLPFSYPFSDYDRKGAPLVYITPDHSKSWYLRPTNNVDPQGKFYHPYLSNWYRDCVESSGDISDYYNLIQLINVIYQSVKQEVPIVLEAPVTTNAPPKPAKITTESPLRPQNTSHQSSPTRSAVVSPQSTGQPPLPAKPPKIVSPQHTSSNGVPEKYQRPLPLPQESHSPVFSNPSIDSVAPQHTQSDINQSPHSSRLHQDMTPSRTGIVSPPTKQAQLEPVDLVDSIAQLSVVDLERKVALEKLSQEFNNYFAQDPIHLHTSYANENIQKANALYTQLSRHNQQALENSKNLDEHINHISTQLSNLTNLNQELATLHELNNQSHEKVILNNTFQLPLDELIIPDSPLVKQLYEVVSEIKAVKDTINLISGNFHGCKELVNDKNLDVCVKSLRNLGRELFWLELTKNEIATNIMNLQ
ncbi:STP22 [Candida margitis]|uniref:STP22 n=1 Tax=Candida margitis TaxID=1775924 RepID=UPI002225CB24|nr:STP22 [Candida margitis]KAI5953931.1 STP22 [Candida margitis]